MTPTELKLLAVHKAPVLRLVDICNQYLNWGSAYAKRRAGEYALPFPAFRPTRSQWAPWLVKLEDLAAFIDAQNIKSEQSWRNSQV